MKSYNTLIIFTEALKFASYKHRNQRRKAGDIPYINHPIQVVSILTNAGVTDYSVLSAAILHDTVQDTDTTPEQLQQHFGQHIKNLVLQCSDDKLLGKVQRKRKQIQKAYKASNQAKLIKIADKLSNCRDLLKEAPKNWSKDRIFGYFLWADAVCQNLRGVNKNLDQSLNEFFKAAGVSNVPNQDKNKQLEEYYVILGQSKGQK